MKKFLASVGNAKLLARTANGVEHVADVRTLTESTLSFTTSMEEVRAGEGAQLYGRFSHDAGMTIQLTDAMFDLKYIAKQVGDNIDGNGELQNDLTSKTYEYSGSGDIALSDAQPIGDGCGLQYVVAWIRPSGCDKSTDWKAVVLDENKNIKSTDLTGMSGSICIEYFKSTPGHRVNVYSNFIPSELILLLTTKLFAGDASAPETGTEVGHITVKVPRFQLDGQFDLSMAMSSAATMSLNGTALATSDGTCDEKGIYAEIVEVITGDSFVGKIEDLVVDTETAEVGMPISGIVVYASTGNGASIQRVPAQYVTVLNGTEPATGNFVAATEYTIKVADDKNEKTESYIAPAANA